MVRLQIWARWTRLRRVEKWCPGRRLRDFETRQIRSAPSRPTSVINGRSSVIGRSISSEAFQSAKWKSRFSKFASFFTGRSRSESGRSRSVSVRSCLLSVRSCKVSGRSCLLSGKSCSVFGKSCLLSVRSCSVFGRSRLLSGKNYQVFGRNLYVFKNSRQVLENSCQVSESFPQLSENRSQDHREGRSEKANDKIIKEMSHYFPLYGRPPPETAGAFLSKDGISISCSDDQIAFVKSAFTHWICCLLAIE